MLAYIFDKQGKPKLTEKEKPSLKAGSGAVIKLEACSICGTDIRTYRFGSNKIPDGRILGHEIVGRIAQIKEKYSNEFPVGTYVSMAPAIGCGNCRCCKQGFTNMCDDLKTIGFEYDGGFAEYMSVPECAFEMGNVYRLPQEGNHTKYALSEPLACVMNAQSYLHIAPGDCVLIIGSGIIGCMHAELAVHAKAGKVVIAETSQERICQAEKLLEGVSFINSSKENLEEKIKELTQGNGADVVVTACSVGKVQEQGMKLLAKMGRISLFGGLPGEPKGFLDSNLIHYRELSVYGVHASTPEQNKKAMEYIRDGVIDAEKYISACYPLSRAGEAFEEAEKGEAMKLVVTM